MIYIYIMYNAVYEYRDIQGNITYYCCCYTQQDTTLYRWRHLSPLHLLRMLTNSLQKYIFLTTAISNHFYSKSTKPNKMFLFNPQEHRMMSLCFAVAMVHSIDDVIRSALPDTHGALPVKGLSDYYFVLGSLIITPVRARGPLSQDEFIPHIGRCPVFPGNGSPTTRQVAPLGRWDGGVRGWLGAWEVGCVG